MTLKPIIIGLGEALLDIFPDEARLGGAPLNFTVHAHQLGNEGVVVSRIGQDAYAERVIQDLKAREMRTDHIQSDPDLMTGLVRVTLIPGGDHEFDIVKGVAWDNLQWDPDMDSLSAGCRAVCFGTLAQRNGQSRNTIYRFVDAAKNAIRIFDVNLRQDYYNRRILEHSCELASAVKCNNEELQILNKTFNLGSNENDICNNLIKKFNLKWLALTQGAQGTVVYDANQRHEVSPSVVDTSQGDAVGAGDATTAALAHGYIRGWSWERTLGLANMLGGYVASQKGACPPLNDSIKALL